MIKAKGCPKEDAGITFDIYENMVVKDYVVKHSFVIPLNFIRDKYECTLKRKSLQKTIRKTYDKRIIIQDYQTVPYGSKGYAIGQTVNNA